MYVCINIEGQNNTLKGKKNVFFLLKVRKNIYIF